MTESTKTAYDPSICESCGEEFGCGAKLDGCWCAEITISDEVTQDLRSEFKACLCRKCLETAALAQKHGRQLRISVACK